MTSELKEILCEGDVNTMTDIKPVFLGIASVLYGYCNYIRKSVYIKAKATGELEYYKEKTNQWEEFMRGHVNIFLDMYELGPDKSIYNNSNLDMLLTQVGTVWQNVSMLSEEANHKLNLNLLSFINFYRDLNRSDKLNNLLGS